ncbi:hypothetical protein [Wolbachia endosymbiont (group A) of Brachyopa scutellaris]
MLHSITQNPYSPNPMHYLQLSFLDPSVKHWDDTLLDGDQCQLLA